MADDLLNESKELFDICVEREADDRATGHDDISFARMEEQWPSEIRKQRELDGRPCLTFNKLGAFRRQVVNDARQNRPQINVHPADDAADAAVAQVYEGLIRNIEYCSDADTVYDTALEAAVDGGVGYFEINTQYASDDTFDLDIRIQAITNPFSIYRDPFSTRHDSADWNDAFQVDTIKIDDFKHLWPGAQTANWETSPYGGLTAPWLDDEKVMLAKRWRRVEVQRTVLALSSGEVVGEDDYLANMDLFDATGVEIVGERRAMSHQVKVCLLSGAEVLEERDWIGSYIPIIPVYGDVIYFEGRMVLRSLIHSAKDSQRKFNYDRTMSTELTSLAPKVPFIGPKGAFKSDADKWATANTENHPFIEYDVVPSAGGAAPQRQPWAGPAAGAIQEAELAAADMKDILGLQNASMGVEDAKEASGRAILARMREGDVSTFHFSDNRNRAIRHGGRVMIDLIPKVYTGARMVRVLDATGVPSIVATGQPTNVPHGPTGQPMIAQPMLGLNAGQLTTLQKTLDLSAGKYDLAVEAGPSFTTRREEAANQMIQLIQAFPEAAPVLGPMLAKNLDWPGADEIASALQGVEQQGQGKGQAEAAAAQAKVQAEGAIKQQQLVQEGALKSKQLDQEMALERMRMLGKLRLEHEEMQMRQALARDEAMFDAQLAEREAAASIALKREEIEHQADQTVDLPETTIGGRIG